MDRILYARTIISDNLTSYYNTKLSGYYYHYLLIQRHKRMTGYVVPIWVDGHWATLPARQ